MERDALLAYIMDVGLHVHHGMVGNGIRQRAGDRCECCQLSCGCVVVVVYTWSATVMSAALQNIMQSVTVIKPRGVRQKLLNSSKVDEPQCAVVRQASSL